MNYILPDEAAANVAAAIDNDASEASPTETENAQTSSGQVINNQRCEKGHSTKNSDGHEEQQAQATVTASAAYNCNAADGSENASVKPSRKRLKPNYSIEEQEQLKKQTAVVEAEIQRVINDPRYHATPVNDGENAIINLTQAKTDGINLLTPTINRIHGKDQDKTGESIEKYGPQEVLLVVTRRMAEAAGLEVSRFQNDNTNSLVTDDDLVTINGNGRGNHLSGLPLGQWPKVLAIFPSKDANGFHNISKVFEEVNTNIKPWATQDFMQKRMLEDRESAHPGWKYINQLLQKGYLYQAACVAATFGSDRIKKGQIISGDNSNEIFKYFEFAKLVHEALVAKFGEGDDKVLKTKVFPMHVASLWQDLRDECGTQDATSKMVDFINQLSASVVEDIKKTKTMRKDGVKVQDRDEKRKELLNTEFNKFMDSEK